MVGLIRLGTSRHAVSAASCDAVCGHHRPRMVAPLLTALKSRRSRWMLAPRAASFPPRRGDAVYARHQAVLKNSLNI